MDSKKVIERLIKIADNQQKIINKLAQAAEMGNSGAAPGAKDRQMEGIVRANLARLLPTLKVMEVHVAGAASGHPEVKIQGEGKATPQQVSGAVVEAFLYENMKPTIYYNGNVA